MKCFEYRSRCKHQHCWICYADYKRIAHRGNQHHKSDCRYHTNNLPGAPGHEAWVAARDVSRNTAANAEVGEYREAGEEEGEEGEQEGEENEEEEAEGEVQNGETPADETQTKRLRQRMRLPRVVRSPIYAIQVPTMLTRTRTKHDV